MPQLMNRMKQIPASQPASFMSSDCTCNFYFILLMLYSTSAEGLVLQPVFYFSSHCYNSEGTHQIRLKAHWLLTLDSKEQIKEYSTKMLVFAQWVTFLHKGHNGVDRQNVY